MSFHEFCFPPQVVESDDENGYHLQLEGFLAVYLGHFKNHLQHPSFMWTFSKISQHERLEPAKSLAI